MPLKENQLKINIQAIRREQINIDIQVVKREPNQILTSNLLKGTNQNQNQN